MLAPCISWRGSQRRFIFQVDRTLSQKVQVAPRRHPARLIAKGSALTVGFIAGTCCIRAAFLKLTDVPAPVAGHHSSKNLLRQSDSAVLTRRRLLLRAFWLAWSFSLALLFAPVAVLSRRFREAYYYQVVYDAIVFSRSAALTKWAQWACMRLDLLPASLCIILSQLQSDAPTHSLKHTLAELADAGVTVVDGTSAEAGTLSELEEVPYASGSIAQVHVASFGGQKAIVKVRHPYVDEELLLDFEIMRRAASAVHECVPSLRWLHAPDTVSQFEAAMSGQCDLSMEARHLEMFSYNFRHKSDWVAFPKVLFSSPAILIESFEPGELARDLCRRGSELDRAEAHFLVARGEDVYLQMLLVDNFMHADLHPGNLVYRKVGLLRKPHLTLLDAGMAAELTEEERRNFIGLLQGFGDGDGAAVGESVLSFSRNACAGAKGFKADVIELCREKCRGYGTGIDLGVVLRDMMQLMYRHGVTVDGNYATLIANMLCLEALTSQLEPRFNVIDVAYPLLRGHQLLGDELFGKIFRFSQVFIPLPAMELFYKFMLYAALHGESLKRFQI